MLVLQYFKITYAMVLVALDVIALLT